MRAKNAKNIKNTKRQKGKKSKKHRKRKKCKNVKIAKKTLKNAKKSLKCIKHKKTLKWNKLWSLNTIWSTLELLDFNKLSVTKVTIVSWMLLGVYYTRDVFHSYGRCEDSHCILCKDLSISPAVESLSHMILQCPALAHCASGSAFWDFASDSGW